MGKIFKISKGIVLDKDISEAFKQKAFAEGFLTGYDREERLSPSDYIGFSRHSMSKELAYTAYSSLAIFGKVFIHINPISIKNREETLPDTVICYDTLTEEGVVELLPHSFRWHNFNDINLKDFISKKNLVINHALNRNAYLYARKNNKQKYFKAFSLVTQQLNERVEGLWDEEVESEWSEMWGDDDEWKWEINWRRQNKELGFRKLGDLFLNYPEMQTYIERILISYRDLSDILQTSNRMQCFSRTSLPMINENDISYKLNSKLSDSLYRTYEIILEEECTFPFPRTLSAALKIRNDKRVLEFRQILMQWATALLDGDVGTESLLRKEIAKANREIKKISTYRKIGKIITFATIPVALASAILGAPVGIFLLPIGPAIHLKSAAIEKKNRWLLLGK